MIKTKCIFCGKEYEYDENNVKIIDPEYRSKYDSSKFCCKKCSYKHTAAKSFKTFRERNPGVNSPCHLPGVQDKVKKTMVEKYGVEYISQSKEIRKKIQETCIEKYGSKTPLENKEIYQKTHETNITNHDGKHYFATEEARELTAEGHRTEEYKKWAKETYDPSKRKQAIIDKYGVDNTFKLKEFQDRIKQTNLDRYGVNNPGKLPEIIAKRMETRMLSNIKNQSEFNKEFILSKFITNDRFDAESCAQYFGLTIHAVNYFKIKFGIEYLNLVSVNNTLESEFYQYIQSLTDEEIIRHERKLFDYKMELDIYIPTRKIAFEFNGNYWHSQNVGVSKEYHFWKTQMCKSRGIRLIHIWEHEWVKSKEKCKNFMSSIFNSKISDEDGYPCIVENRYLKTINYNYVNENSVKILFKSNNKIISIVEFIEKDKNNWEIISFNGNLSNLNQILKCFKFRFHPETISVCLDSSKYDDIDFISNGFILDYSIEPTHFWVKSGNEYTDNDLITKFGINEADFDKLLNDSKFLKCYNSGFEFLVLK